MSKIPVYANRSRAKYDGEDYNEPAWYPPNPYRLRRYLAFRLKHNDAGYHFSEIETYWDEGRDAILKAVKELATAERVGDGTQVIIPNDDAWYPKGEYKENMEKAEAQGYGGFASHFAENHRWWSEGVAAMIDTIKHLPSAKLVKDGIQVFIADDQMIEGD